MKVFNIVKSAVSTLCAILCGVYLYSFFVREVDFFTIVGFITCILLGVATSPLLERYLNLCKRGK